MKVLWVAYNLSIDPLLDEGELVLVLSKEEVNRLGEGEEVCVAGIMVKRHIIEGGDRGGRNV